MKKNIIKGVVIIVFISVVFLLVRIIKIKYDFRNAIHIKAEKIIDIPNISQSNTGFTCTGFYYDKENKQFYVGNAGKEKPGDDIFKATIEVISKNFTDIEKSIECYKIFPQMRDIQGVTKATDNTLWICSYGENKVRNLDVDGKPKFEFGVKSPSGISFDPGTESLWVLSNDRLINYSTDGYEIKSFPVKVKGQDQLYFDEVSNTMYFTAGVNYKGENYVYTINLKNGKYNPVYILEDSYAIEGITIIDEYMYILNDGYYHDAKEANNQVNIYRLKGE